MKIPHPHWWLVTRRNSLTYEPNEQHCFFCRAHRHLPFANYFRGGPWLPGRYPE